MNERKRIEAALLLEGLDDMLHLGWMERTTRVVTGRDRQDSEVLNLTLEAIYHLLKVGYAGVGNTVRDERGMLSVAYWDSSPDAVIAEIRNRLEATEDPANREFIAWLELTDKGREEAERLDGEGCDPFKLSDAG